MNTALIAAGILLVVIILIHMIFKVIKFTISVFIFGVMLIAVCYVFQHYFGIDLIAEIQRLI